MHMPWLTHPVTRKEADDLFYELMIANKTDRYVAYKIWLGVRIGGAPSWVKEDGTYDVGWWQVWRML